MSAPVSSLWWLQVTRAARLLQTLPTGVRALPVTQCSVPVPCQYLAQAAPWCLQVNTATRLLQHLLTGVRSPPVAHPSSAAFGGLLMPGTGHLMLPVSNSILQFFDLQKDEQAQLLQVRRLRCMCMLSLLSGRVGHDKQALLWPVRCHSMLHGDI